THRHHIAILQQEPILEAEEIGPEEMNVNIPGDSMRLDLEMMMFEIGKGMAHPLFAAGKLPLPDRLSVALDSCSPAHFDKIRIDNQLRPDRAGAQFRLRQIKIVFGLKHVVG